MQLAALWLVENGYSPYSSQIGEPVLPMDKDETKCLLYLFELHSVFLINFGWLQLACAKVCQGTLIWACLSIMVPNKDEPSQSYFSSWQMIHFCGRLVSRRCGRRIRPQNGRQPGSAKRPKTILSQYSAVAQKQKTMATSRPVSLKMTVLQSSECPYTRNSYTEPQVV